MKRLFMLCLCNMLTVCSYAADTKIATIAYDPSHTYAYLGQLTTTQIHYCAITTKKTLGACRATGPTYFIRPISLAMHPEGKCLYVVDDVYRFIAKCTIQTATGQIQDCQEVPFAYQNPNSIAFSLQNNQIYIAHASGVSRCAIDANGDFENCALTLSTQNIASLSLNSGGSKAYILSTNAMEVCTIAPSTGVWYPCKTFYFNQLQAPQHALAHNIYSNTLLNHEFYKSSFSVDETGILSLVNRYSDGSDFRCNITQNTADYRRCFSDGDQQGYSTPLSAVIDANGSRMYILSAGLVKLICSLNSNGLLNHCIPTLQELHIPIKDIVP